MRASALCLVLLAGCGSVPTGPDSGDPREAHVLAETARFAAALRLKVTAVVTDEVYMVPAIRPAYPGEKVPAAGWNHDGHIKYWRPAILRESFEYGTLLAAEEVCHSITEEHDARLAACIAQVTGGNR